MVKKKEVTEEDVFAEEILEVEEDHLTAPDDLAEGLVAEDTDKIADPMAAFKGEPVDVIHQNMEKVVAALGKEVAERLDKMEKFKIVIPKDPINERFEEDNYVVVCINSRVFQIQRNMPVLLPKPIIKQLQTAGYNPTLAM